MNNTTHHESDGARPLANPRHEQFAQAYAGEAHGNAAEAYRLAGYKPKNAKSAASAGLRLLINVDILARIKALRSAIEDRLHIDRLWLAQHRMEIVESATATAGERLAAMRDIEKAMGWTEPDKVETKLSGLDSILNEVDGLSRGIVPL